MSEGALPQTNYACRASDGRFSCTLIINPDKLCLILNDDRRPPGAFTNLEVTDGRKWNEILDSLSLPVDATASQVCCELLMRRVNHFHSSAALKEAAAAFPGWPR